MFTYHGLEQVPEAMWRLGHMFFVRQDDEMVVDQASAWCAENLPFDDQDRWIRTHFHIIVFDDRDATVFRMRWC